MKLIKPSVEIWTPQSYSLKDGFRHAERCGRICYVSNDKITGDSYKKFCNNIIKSYHTSVMEHMTLYLVIPIGSPIYDKYYMGKYELIKLFQHNPYSFVHKSISYNTVDNTPEEYKSFVSHNGPTTIYYVTTNYRVILDNNYILEHSNLLLEEGILPYIVDRPIYNYHKERITVHWTISRGIADEFMRHRALSPSCQSTRYCNFSKDRFNNEVTFIKPTWYIDMPEESSDIHKIVEYTKTLKGSEKHYMRLLKLGLTPQEARDALNFAIKTELIQTGTYDQWKAFLKLRSHKAGARGVHPDANYIANKLYLLLSHDNKVYTI